MHDSFSHGIASNHGRHRVDEKSTLFIRGCGVWGIAIALRIPHNDPNKGLRHRLAIEEHPSAHAPPLRGLWDKRGNNIEAPCRRDCAEQHDHAQHQYHPKGHHHQQPPPLQDSRPGAVTRHTLIVCVVLRCHHESISLAYPDSAYRHQYRVRISRLRPILLWRTHPCSCRPKDAYVSMQMWRKVESMKNLGIRPLGRPGVLSVNEQKM